MPRHAALLGLALLLAPAARAQSAAELVDEVVAALRVAEQTESVLGSMRLNAGAGDGLFDASAVPDSVRAALLRDPRPDLLREALPHLRSPGYVRMLDRSREAAEDPDGALAAAVAALYGEPPKKGTLADSVLAARYVRAAGTVEQVTTIMEQTVRAVAASVPGALAEIEAGGQTADEVIAAQIAAAEEQLRPTYVAAARVAFAGVPVGEVEGAIAYYESPAGAHVTRALFDGTLAAVLPGVVRWASAMAEGSFTDGSEDTAVIKPGKDGL